MKKNKLSAIAILVTTRCDLLCRHCLHGYPTSHHDFPLDLLPGLLAEGRRYGVKQVGLTGGEPGMHPEFERLVGMIVEAGYTWSFTTNGQHPERYLPVIERYHDSLCRVGLSLDGADAVTHDTNRRKAGAFKSALAAAGKFTSRGVNTEFTVALNPTNHAQIGSILDLAAQTGVKGIKFGGTIPSAVNQNLLLNDRQSLEASQYISAVTSGSKMQIQQASALFTPGGVHFCKNLTMGYFLLF